MKKIIFILVVFSALSCSHDKKEINNFYSGIKQIIHKNPNLDIVILIDSINNYYKVNAPNIKVIIQQSNISKSKLDKIIDRECSNTTVIMSRKFMFYPNKMLYINEFKKLIDIRIEGDPNIFRLPDFKH
jgi:hypothetical protein